MRPIRLAALSVLALASSAALLHCSSDNSKASAGDAGPDAEDASTSDGPVGDDVSDAGNTEASIDSGLTMYCEAFATYALGCGYTLCDDGGPLFVSGCDGFDNKVNSLTRRQAELMCLNTANCNTATRRDCDYQQYIQAIPTSAQQKLVQDYCATCPTDGGSCAAKAIAYNADAGSAAVAPIFLAAWEYTDQVTTEIDVLCTGSALMQPDGSTCANAFGACVKVALATVPEWETYVSCQ